MVQDQDIAKNFGKNLKKYRKLTKISQEWLALESGIDRSYIGRVERGEVNITLEKVYLIAKALQCNVRDIIP